jgi:hypothetical protein
MIKSTADIKSRLIKNLNDRERGLIRVKKQILKKKSS